MHWDTMYCLDTDDLVRVRKGEALSTLDMEHLRHCEYCSEALEAVRVEPTDAVTDDTTPTVPERIRELFEEERPKIREALAEKPKPDEIAFGQIYSTRAASTNGSPIPNVAIPRLVVVLSGILDELQNHPVVSVGVIGGGLIEDVPGSEMIAEHEAPLGFPFVVELWGRQTTLVACLDRFLGTVSDDAYVRLREAMQAEVATKEGWSKPLTEQHHWRIKEEAEQTAYLRAPVQALLG